MTPMVAVSCGLPGVGKSTFINALLRSDVFDVFKVDLDLVYRQLKGQSSPSAGDTHENSAEFANADWRLTRSLAMLAVTDLLLMLRDEVIDFDTKVSTSQLESSALSLKACFDVVPTTFTGDRRVLIVVDDNMYYKSMRREYYNLARRHACAFAVLYFKSPGVGLATCLQRNAQRALSERVPDEVVQRIADRFEEPEATCADWEARSLITIVTDDAAAAAVRTNAECGHVRYSGSNLERTGAFFAALDELWSRPPMSVDALRDVDVSKAADRERSMHNFDEQLELSARSVVSSAISQLTILHPTVPTSKIAKRLGELKRSAVLNWKSTQLIEPATVDSVAEARRESLRRFADEFLASCLNESFI